MEHKISEPTEAAITATVGKLEASALPGLADEFNAFIKKESNYRQGIINSWGPHPLPGWVADVWSEYEDAIIMRASDLLREASNARTKIQGMGQDKQGDDGR